MSLESNDENWIRISQNGRTVQEFIQNSGGFIQFIQDLFLDLNGSFFFFVGKPWIKTNHELKHKGLRQIGRERIPVVD